MKIEFVPLPKSLVVWLDAIAANSGGTVSHSPWLKYSAQLDEALEPHTDYFPTAANQALHRDFLRGLEEVDGLLAGSSAGPEVARAVAQAIYRLLKSAEEFLSQRLSPQYSRLRSLDEVIRCVEALKAGKVDWAQLDGRLESARAELGQIRLSARRWNMPDEVLKALSSALDRAMTALAALATRPSDPQSALSQLRDALEVLEKFPVAASEGFQSYAEFKGYWDEVRSGIPIPKARRVHLVEAVENALQSLATATEGEQARKSKASLNQALGALNAAALRVPEDDLVGKLLLAAFAGSVPAVVVEHYLDSLPTPLRKLVGDSLQTGNRELLLQAVEARRA